MTDTERGVWVRVGNSWKPVDQEADSNAGIWVRVGGSWKRIDSNDSNAGIWARESGTWKRVYPKGGSEPPIDPPDPGTYILPATALWLPTDGSNGYAEFDTAPYQGYITEIRLRASWKSGIINGLVTGISGRPNGNFYRNITHDSSWSNRTIDHRIDTFDATSLTDFNNGDAYGFTISGGLAHGNYWSNVQLNLTVA